jgi:hypothetical protein
MLCAAGSLAACSVPYVSMNPPSWTDPNLRVTHPNGDGPQVVRWGPPNLPSTDASFPH